MQSESYHRFILTKSPSTLSSVAVSELLICKFRFGIYLAFLAYFLFFPVLSKGISYGAIVPIMIAGSLWIVINTGLFILLRIKKFERWMSWSSAGGDVLVVAFLNYLVASIHPLNYSDNVIISLYFTIIAVTAIRKDTLLVYISGFGSAAIYMGLTIYFQNVHQTGMYDHLYFNGKMVASVAFLDQVAKTFAIMVTAWVVAYVTQKIRSAQVKYQTLFDNVPDGIVLTSSEGTVETINQSFLDMVNESLPDIVGKPVNNLFASAYRKNQHNAMVTQRTSSTEIPVAISEASVWPQKDNTQKILSIRNLTVQQELRGQVNQAQKTEALGQIARGLAHDFNNLLGGILGAVSLIRVKLSKAPQNEEHQKLRMHAQLIQDCAENARDILKRLLALSRVSEKHSTAFDIRKLVMDLRDFTQKTFGDLYEVILNIELDESAVVEGDESSVFQALLNVCLNAKESMPGGGRIRIAVNSCGPAGLAELSHEVRATDARYFHIRITDRGTGMTQSVQKRCLEPFFSTKETARRGTGLGLSIAHNIIRHHNGVLNIASTTMRGTSIDVYLPGTPSGRSLP